MTVHQLKIKEAFADAIIAGTKTFDIRKNDRGYQTGDRIEYEVWGDDFAEHPILGRQYEMTYIVNGWGLESSYIAFSLREVKEGGAGDQQAL